MIVKQSLVKHPANTYNSKQRNITAQSFENIESTVFDVSLQLL